ncbi:MAG: hypothetical protein AAF797_12600 [Planctomycetota bacterium]
MSSHDSNPPEPSPSSQSLHPDDAAILDARIAARAAGQSTGPLPPGSADRAPRVDAVLALLDQAQSAEPAPADDLAQRTLDQVLQDRQRLRFAQQVDLFRQPNRGLGISLRQLLSAAAILLIGASLLLPVLSRSQADAARRACLTNLGALGQAFSSYAASNKDQLPRHRTTPGSDWYHVGHEFNRSAPNATVRSNTANLFILAHDGYTTLNTLACPSYGSPAGGDLGPQATDWSRPEQVSYSYQNQFHAEPVRLGSVARMAILADKNPLFLIQSQTAEDRYADRPRTVRFRVNLKLQRDAPSPAHGGRGQNVLFSDATADWLESPTTPTTSTTPTASSRAEQLDHIWTSAASTPHTRYTGSELPVGPGDSFLVP